MKRYAIYGAGSLGTELGAYITKNGSQIDLINRNIEPSMLQNLKNKKPCEVDAIKGVVCEWGKKCGVETPINDRIVEIIKKEQAGELECKADSISLFDDLL